MKAAYVEQTGPPEVIRYGDLPTPKPGRGQCLIRVGAHRLQEVSTIQRTGRWREKLC